MKAWMSGGVALLAGAIFVAALSLPGIDGALLMAIKSAPSMPGRLRAATKIAPASSATPPLIHAFIRPPPRQGDPGRQVPHVHVRHRSEGWRGDPRSRQDG